MISQSWLTFWKDVAELVQALTTIVAILVGGFWSYRLFWLHRQRYPRAVITHQVTHKALTDKTILLHIIVNIANTGDVLLHLETGELWILQILPLLPQIENMIEDGKDLLSELRNLIEEEGKELWKDDIPWPLVTSRQTNWKNSKIQIEPGNITQLRYDLILSNEIRTIRIFTFLKNSFKRPFRVGISKDDFPRKIYRDKGLKDAIGWSFSSMYDIPVVKEDHKLLIVHASS